MDREPLYHRIASSRLVRSLADALLRRRARRRLAGLDRLPPARCQLRTLLGLVHRARATRFGRDHDFRRIRTPEDFRRLVPLRSAAGLWQEYGAPALPSLHGATWPGRVHYLASCETAPGQPAVPLPVSPELVACHREAFWTALAFAAHARPRARLLSGSVLLVGGGAALTPLGTQAGADNLEELTRGQLPRLLRPYTAVAPYSGDAALEALAARGASLPVTCLVGNAGRLAKFAACLREQTGRPTLRDAWPGLEAVLYSRGPADLDRAELARVVGPRPLAPGGLRAARGRGGRRGPTPRPAANARRPRRLLRVRAAGRTGPAEAGACRPGRGGAGRPLRPGGEFRRGAVGLPGRPDGLLREGRPAAAALRRRGAAGGGAERGPAAQGRSSGSGVPSSIPSTKRRHGGRARKKLLP